MSKENKQLWEILVPTVRSIEPPRFYTTRYHRVWDSKVREITGGLTIMSPNKGQWISPDGKLFKERMIPVRIMCNPTEIEEIAQMTARYYNQQAVMFFKVTDTVEIRYYDEGNS
jgi:hypothetical protein